MIAQLYFSRNKSSTRYPSELSKGSCRTRRHKTKPNHQQNPSNTDDLGAFAVAAIAHRQHRSPQRADPRSGRVELRPARPVT
jgi:hypothetical protein